MPRLRDAGDSVSATDRELDVTSLEAVQNHVSKFQPDAIVHLAAQSSPRDSWTAPELTYRVNFVGTRTILEATRTAAPNARVLLIGSAEQYGSTVPGAPAFDESTPLRPVSPYARSKTAADLLGADFAERGVDVVRVRAFNHTGPRQSDHFVLPSFARQVAEIAAGRCEAVMRVGNLDSVRDFLDVDDVIDAYMRLIHGDAPAGAYNVARGEGHTIRSLLDTLIALAGVSPLVVVDPDLARPTDFSVGDSTRLREATGWKPLISIETALERLWVYWRDRVNAL